MRIATISGDDEITKAMNAALYATVKALNKDGYISTRIWRRRALDSE